MAETAKERYERLKPRRDAFLRRARRYAELTLPGLMPADGFSSTEDLPEPYQGLGARAVNNLASRLMIAMYPPGMPSFKLDVPADVRIRNQKLTLDKDTEQGLALAEQLIASEIERKQWRFPTYLELQYLIVTGNALEQLLPDNRIRVFRLDQYVVVRDGTGEEKEIIVEEAIPPANLSDRLRPLVSVEDGNNAQRVHLYTWARRNTKTGEWEIHQELDGNEVPKSRGKYKISPFRALRWNGVIGEDYGRGKVEEHFPDFKALDGLKKAILDGSAMAARNIILIRPNAAGGLNLRRKIAKADNGEMITGNPEDVQFLQYTNASGLQVAQQEIQALLSDLSAAFMMNSAWRRDAERVTATELRMMSEELEGTLGGVYSMLATELQAHRLSRMILQMQSRNELPQWPQGMVSPTILTGLEALGREQDVQRVTTALQAIAALPTEAHDYVKMDMILGKLFNGLGLPDAVRTQQEVQQIQQQRMMTEAIQQIAQQGGGAAVEQYAQQALGAAAGQQPPQSA